MICPSSPVQEGINWSVIPSSWNDDPLPQLSALRGELTQQLLFPSTQLCSFARAAAVAISRLPSKYCPPERAETLTDIAFILHLDNQNDAAISVGQGAVDSAVRGGHCASEARARMVLGTLLGENYDFEGSLREFASALEIARDQEDLVREGRVLNNLGGLYSDAGLCVEAAKIFERLADHWQRTGDPGAMELALHNAAVAALRLGNNHRAVDLLARIPEPNVEECATAQERLLLAQFTHTYCQALIALDRFSEAAERVTAAAKGIVGVGLGQAETFVLIDEAMTAFLLDPGKSHLIDAAITRAREASPNLYWSALDSAIRAYEKADRPDSALTFQRDLIEFTKNQKFCAVRRMVGHASPEEQSAGAKTVQLSAAVDRRLSSLVSAAITQALRAGHDAARIFRVSEMAQRFATDEGWADERVASLFLAAKLIDIGSMVVPDGLLTKRGSLSAQEKRIVDEHAACGAELLARTQLTVLDSCIRTVRLHHEHWDGSGPLKTSGEEIPPDAVVVSLCDSFDALTHDRPWRKAYTNSAALKIIEKELGTHFSPVMGRRFLDWVDLRLAKEADFLSNLASDASENGFVRTLERIRSAVTSFSQAL